MNIAVAIFGGLMCAVFVLFSLAYFSTDNGVPSYDNPPPPPNRKYMGRIPLLPPPDRNEKPRIDYNFREKPTYGKVANRTRLPEPKKPNIFNRAIAFLTGKKRVS